MMADLSPGVLLEEPALFELEDGLVVYVADAELEPFGRVIEAIMLPPWPGAFVPWRKGDRVLVGVAGGAGYVLGAFRNDAGSTAHVDFRPRGDGDIRLGPTGGEYQPVALFNRLSAEVVNLKAQIDALAVHVNGLTAITAVSGGGGSPAVGTPTNIGLGALTAVNDATIAGGIRGGDPAAQLKGVKA